MRISVKNLVLECNRILSNSERTLQGGREYITFYISFNDGPQVGLLKFEHYVFL